MTVINPFDFFLEPRRRDVSVRLRAELRAGAGALPGARARRRRCSRRYLDGDRPRAAQRTIDFLVELNQRSCSSDIALPDPHGAGRADAARRRWRSGSGSCRDIGLAAGADPAPPGPRRALRLGLPDPAHARREVARRPVAAPTSDFTDLHAWAEVYLPGAGWIGLDPTSGLLAGEGHIPLACTPEPVERGADHRRRSTSARSSSSFEMTRRRGSTKTPRVTKPYTRRRSGRRSTRSATRSTRAWPAATCA